MNDDAKPFRRFRVAWTPTLSVMLPDGAEVYRIEGYLPPELFRPELEMGLARAALVRKRYQEAEQIYEHVVQKHPSHAAEATYWRSVCRYSESGDGKHLAAVATELQEKHPDSVWTIRSSVWAPQQAAGEKKATMR
jgi:hypothetical protein